MKEIKEYKGETARSTTKNISIAEFKRRILGFEEKGVEASSMMIFSPPTAAALNRSNKVT